MALYAWIIALAAFLSVIAAIVFITLVVVHPQTRPYAAAIRRAGDRPGRFHPQLPGRRRPPQRP